jgi:hypothetical protein
MGVAAVNEYTPTDLCGAGPYDIPFEFLEPLEMGLKYESELEDLLRRFLNVAWVPPVTFEYTVLQAGKMHKDSPWQLVSTLDRSFFECVEITLRSLQTDIKMWRVNTMNFVTFRLYFDDKHQLRQATVRYQDEVLNMAREHTWVK